MLWFKIKCATVAILAVGVLGSGIGLIAFRAGAEDRQVVQATTPGPDKGTEPAVPAKLRGQRLLVAFDLGGATGEEAKHSRVFIELSVKQHGAEVIEIVAPNLFLIDPRDKKPAELLKDLPHRQGLLPYCQGALVMQDGQYREAIGYQNPHHKDKLLVPEPCARLGFGLGDGRGQQLRRMARQKYTDVGLTAEEFEEGNNLFLKVTPGKGKTLLDVFAQTKADFHYTEKKAPH